jgi:predicted RNase H-like HicB family nuclease
MNDNFGYRPLSKAEGINDDFISGYRAEFTLLSEEDGGKYLIKFPDLPGCYTAGVTIQEAIESAPGAIELWSNACRMRAIKVPLPLKSQKRVDGPAN